MLEVETLQAAGREYARLRRLRGLPPVKRALQAVPGEHGPARVRCKGVVYTLVEKGSGRPCPAA